MHRLKKTAPTNLTQTALVCFGLVRIFFKVNRTTPHAFLSCGLDEFYPQNRTKHDSPQSVIRLNIS